MDNGSTEGEATGMRNWSLTCIYSAEIKNECSYVVKSIQSNENFIIWNIIKR